MLAASVRLLDRGFFRIGSEDYAVRNESYGLATMRKEHVQVQRERFVVFNYVAKSGKKQYHGMVQEDIAEIVSRLKRRRGGGPELLAYKAGGEWRDIKSTDINLYLKDATGADYSAKDFRTWNATVLAAVGVAVAGPAAATPTSRKRAVNRAVKEVAHYLGNTPAVARASYIDPRVFDRFCEGLTIDPTIAVTRADEPAIQGAVEEAVLELIHENADAEGVAAVEDLDELVAAAA